MRAGSKEKDRQKQRETKTTYEVRERDRNREKEREREGGTKKNLHLSDHHKFAKKIYESDLDVIINELIKL